jgi:Uma2 family endonuclease
MTTSDKLFVVVPANFVAGPRQGDWTYEDYAALPEDKHCYEVVGGVLYMSPAPNLDHQGIVLRIAYYLLTYIEFTGLGRVFTGPADVELSCRDVVQPDVFVVLNEHLDRLSRSRVIGAPDLVVEVSSPSTVRHDLMGKQLSYARAGVPEYWVVNPDAETVEVLLLEDGAYSSLGVFYGRSVLPSRVASDMPVRVEQFFVKTP